MTIRVGIGGWSYEPWEETFYPAKLAATNPSLATSIAAYAGGATGLATAIYGAI